LAWNEAGWGGGKKAFAVATSVGSISWTFFVCLKGNLISIFGFIKLRDVNEVERLTRVACWLEGCKLEVLGLH
jgi:hypothetical protein